MKRISFPSLALTAFCGLALPSFGQTTVILNDTFADGDRTTQNLPSSSEWFQGGVGSLTVLAPGGPMQGDLGVGATSSASWTTYFAPDGSPITLNNTGDSLKLTWQFTLGNVAAANTSQNFRLALVLTPSAARLTSDAAPGSSTYAGYGTFMNMGLTTLGNSNPFQLMERAAPGTSSALLSAGGSWIGLTNGGTAGNAGFENGVLYTYVMELTRNGSGMDIMSSLTGGTLNGSGVESLSFSDPTANSFSFDTFSLRPSSATGAAQIFDTSLVMVEFTVVPEPTTFLLLGFGVLGLLVHRRIRR